MAWRIRTLMAGAVLLVAACGSFAVDRERYIEEPRVNGNYRVYVAKDYSTALAVHRGLVITNNKSHIAQALYSIQQISQCELVEGTEVASGSTVEVQLNCPEGANG